MPVARDLLAEVQRSIGFFQGIDRKAKIRGVVLLGNTVKLPSYQKFDLGVVLYHDSGFFFQLHGDNVNDTDGITEGDPRNPSAPNGRPIFGTSWRFSVGYDFGD